jgi:Protein of unknown function (DUF2808)
LIAMRRRFRLLSVPAAVMLLTAVLAPPAAAGSISSMTWTQSTATPATAANQSFTGTLATAATPIKSLTITFASGFTVPGTLAATDITALSLNGASQTSNISSVSASGQTVTITLTTTVTPATSQALSLTIGNTKITNPSTPGTYSATVTTNGLTGGAVDSGAVQASFGALTVTLGAIVPQSLTFTLANGGVTLVADPSQASGDTYTVSSALVVSTNAANGFTVTAQLNQPLTRAGGTQTLAALTTGPTSTATWNTSTQKNFWGITRRITGGTDGGGTLNSVGTWGTTWAGLSTTAGTIFSDTGPTNSASMDIQYQVVADYLQSAGTYTATLTYTATGSF